MLDIGIHSPLKHGRSLHPGKKRGTGGGMKIRHIFMKVRGREERLRGKKD